MSLRAEVVRLGLRWLIKRHARPDVAISAIRRRANAAKYLVPNPPRGTSAVRIEASGVPAIRVATRDALRDRHILYLHGGGYVYGSPSHYRDFLWRIAAQTSANVLCIDYRLAPEYPFPAALDDAVQAYRWLLGSGVDPSRTAMMGDSAGGGLVFATMLKLRDAGLPLPAAAVAFSPWTDLAMTGESVRLNAGADPMLDTEQGLVLARCYLGGTDPRNPYASPLYGDLRGLPPSLIQVGSDEILRDDAVRMAERLRAAGCTAEIEIWPCMPHVWHLFARVVPEARQAMERAGAFLRARL